MRQGDSSFNDRCVLGEISEVQLRRAKPASTPVRHLLRHLTRQIQTPKHFETCGWRTQCNDFLDRRLKKMSTGWLLILLLAVFLVLSIREIPHR
jgi:hypothetical protein